MPRVRVSLTSRLPADVVFAAATDFTERRAKLWRDVHTQHLTVHALEGNRADVTEGNRWPLLGVVWERLDYDWSSGHTLAGTVTDSNLFHPGSTWNLRVTADGDGCRVEVDATRRLKGRGRLLWPFFPTGLAAKDVLDYLQKFLDALEAENGS